MFSNVDDDSEACLELLGASIEGAIRNALDDGSVTHTQILGASIGAILFLTTKFEMSDLDIIQSVINILERVREENRRHAN